MKDFIGKLTFNFVMAQLFPGALAAFGVAFSYFTWEAAQPNSILAAAQRVLKTWGDATVPQQLFLVGVCIGTGMSIHGLHWSTLGAQEHLNGGSVYNATWHAQKLWRQVLSAPLRLIKECKDLCFSVAHIRDASLQENVARIGKDHMAQFNFVQDFCLAFGQFFFMSRTL